MLLLLLLLLAMVVVGFIDLVLGFSRDDVRNVLVTGSVVANVVKQVVMLLLLGIGSEELLVHLEVVIIDLFLITVLSLALTAFHVIVL